ncbi:MAG: GDP-mannose 4,6-dehydratase [Acidobacteria bacterium]|nr:GDP-mannose 4,6-dehydratase [Acidobacteriota bacterium]
MRTLITGITGFAGAWLARHLVEDLRQTAVHGLVRWSSDRQPLAGLESALNLIEADLTDGASLVRAVQSIRPELVFHLAASSTVASSWSTPAELMEVNVVGQVRLFEALRTVDLAPVVVVAGSGEIYGRPDGEGPVKESAPLKPVSPYGVSKAAQDLLAYQYHAAYGLPVIRLRLFNHTGPGRPDRFVASSFARQLAEIEAGLRPPFLQVGNLKVVRDFTDVRDVARAYWLAAQRGRPGAVYNVCSGRPVAIEELLNRLLVLSGLSVDVQMDPGRLRQAEVPVLYGDPGRFQAATGWQAEIPLEVTLRDLLEDWRQRVARERVR